MTAAAERESLHDTVTEPHHPRTRSRAFPVGPAMGVLGQDAAWTARRMRRPGGPIPGSTSCSSGSPPSSRAGPRNAGSPSSRRSPWAGLCARARRERWSSTPTPSSRRPSRRRQPASGEEARRVGFLKRFTVFHRDQCDGLPPIRMPNRFRGGPRCCRTSKLSSLRPTPTFASEAKWRSTRRVHDFIQVPPQEAYFEPINWYRTKLHELGHWTGHSTRLNRDFSGPARR